MVGCRPDPVASISEEKEAAGPTSAADRSPEPSYREPARTATAVIAVTPSETSSPARSIHVPETTVPDPSITPYATLVSALPTPPTAVPAPAALLEKAGGVVNILLLGNDARWAQGGRTDSIVLISINRATGQVAMLSIPRDLYVFIPGWTMNRINLALPHGNHIQYGGGGGGELIKDTIRYNLGIGVDHYVRVGFSGFKQIVDALGGVEIVVNCPVQDWRLKSPQLNPEIEANWMPFLLQPGVQQMDGELALWYVRSRRNSNDFDRGRRQQKVLDALFDRLKQSEDLLLHLPSLIEQLLPWLETDMSIGDVLQLATLLPALHESSVKHVLLTGEVLRPWTVPVTGEAVQLLDRKAAEPLLRALTDEDALHQANRSAIRVEVKTSDPIMYRQVAENLAWYGYEPHFQFSDDEPPAESIIHYYGANAKGSFARRLSWIFGQKEADILYENTAVNYDTEYRVILGRDHNPCLPYLSNMD